MWTCILPFGYKSYYQQSSSGGRAWAFRLEVAVTCTAEILPLLAVLSPPSLWCSLFKLCLSNPPPRAADRAVFRGLGNYTVHFLIIPWPAVQSLLVREQGRKKSRRLPASMCQGLQRRKWTCSLKNHGVRLWFWFLPRVICVCAHVLSQCACIEWVCTWQSCRGGASDSRKLKGDPFLIRSFPVLLLDWAWKDYHQEGARPY